MGVEPRRRRPPFEGYGLSESEEGMLSWGWAVERLVAARNYWVSTTRPDGRPHAMPVWGVWLDDALERRVDEVYGPKYDFTPQSSEETDRGSSSIRNVRCVGRAHLPSSATQFDVN